MKIKKTAAFLYAVVLLCFRWKRIFFSAGKMIKWKKIQDAFMFYRFFLFSLFALTSSALRAESFVLQGKECETKLVELIENASDYIDVSVYAMNNKRLIKALIDAHHRGVKLRVLTDRLQAAGNSSRIWDLIKNGVPLRVHTHKRIMHTKIAIYDGKSVSSGSLNWTEPAVHKNEEVCDIFIDDSDYAAQHQKLFDERWAANPQSKSEEWIQNKLAERAGKNETVP